MTEQIYKQVDKIFNEIFKDIEQFVPSKNGSCTFLGYVEHSKIRKKKYVRASLAGH